MVLSLLNGRVNRSDMPNYTLDEETGLYFQSTSLNFPRETFDPDEILDRTFYTHEPPTSPEMNSIIRRFGGNGGAFTRMVMAVVLSGPPRRMARSTMA